MKNDIILKELKIEVSYKCPLSCIHCSSEASTSNDLIMSLEKCLGIINQAYELGVREIAFSGGEPLIWQGLANSVKLCKKLGIKSCIYTSGNCDNIQETILKLSNVGLDRAIFSIYSPIEQEHVRITREINSFKNTLLAITLCNQNGIQTELHFVALATNYQKLVGVVDLAQKYGVNAVSVLRFVPQGRGEMLKGRGTLTRSQNLELIELIKTIRKTGYSIRTGSPFNVLLLNEHPKCMAAQDRLVIAPDLTVYPCDAFKQIKAEQISPQVIACSLSDTSLKDCWENSSYLNAVRQSISQEVNEVCRNCSLHSQCLSGCLAQRFLEYNTLESRRDPACLKLEY